MSEESWISSPGSKAQWSEMSDFYFPSHCTKRSMDMLGAAYSVRDDAVCQGCARTKLIQQPVVAHWLLANPTFWSTTTAQASVICLLPRAPSFWQVLGCLSEFGPRSLRVVVVHEASDVVLTDGLQTWHSQ